MNISHFFNELPYGRAVIIGIILAGIYYLTPLYNSGDVEMAQIQALRTQKGNLETQSKNIQKAVEDAKRYQAIMTQLGDQVDQIVHFVPEKMSAADLMKILSREAKTVGTNILRLNERGQAARRDNSFYQEVAAEMNLEGTYAQLLLFLANLTKSDRIINVRDINIQDSNTHMPGLDDTPILKFSANFVGYRYVGVKQSGKH